MTSRSSSAILQQCRARPEQHKMGKRNKCIILHLHQRWSFQHQQESYALSRAKKNHLIYLTRNRSLQYTSHAGFNLLGPPHRLLDAEQSLITLGVGHAHLPLQGFRHALQFSYCGSIIPHNQFAFWPQHPINLGKNCLQFAPVNKEPILSCPHTSTFAEK